MTSSLRVQGVSHRYGSTPVLDRVDLSIDAGRFAVLLGPSGCGKTTLLSILGGFITPSEGRVWLDDKDVTNLPAARRATTTVFQDYALFPHLSLQDNVAFGLRMRGQGRRSRRQAAQQMLSLVGLEGLGAERPGEISGGQRQRVALARALAVEPEVLLLDEPLGALDLALRRQMQDELKAIQRRVGTTFVHVTHDQEEAMAIADDIIVMNAGRIEDHGSPEAIYLRPRSLFSANFMGESNLVRGELVRIDDAQLHIRSPLGELVLPTHCATGNRSLQPDMPVGLCFRPEQLQVGEAIGPTAIMIEARLESQAFFGAYRRARLQGDGLGVDTLIAELPQAFDISPGDRLRLGIERDHFRVFAMDDTTLGGSDTISPGSGTH